MHFKFKKKVKSHVKVGGNANSHSSLFQQLAILPSSDLVYQFDTIAPSGTTNLSCNSWELVLWQTQKPEKSTTSSLSYCATAVRRRGKDDLARNSFQSFCIDY